MRCREAKKDCFALRAGGECACLNDTRFIRNCPFYKKDETDYVSVLMFKDFPGRRWKRVRGYSGRYFISDWGEVKNEKNHVLKPDNRSKERPFVNLLSENASPVRHYIADLVADAFLPGHGTIDYLDGNKYNCAVYNLRRRS